MKYPTTSGGLAVCSTAFKSVREWDETEEDVARCKPLTSSGLFRSKRESFTLKIISLVFVWV